MKRHSRDPTLSKEAKRGLNTLLEHGSSFAHVKLSEHLSLRLKVPDGKNGAYPTSSIQKGPVLFHDSIDLSGEGVGFGVPVVKYGHRVFFPGTARIRERRQDTLCIWTIAYELNVEERVVLKNGRRVHIDAFYALKERLAWLHKSIPVSRGLIEWINDAFRRAYGIHTTFDETSSVGSVVVSYTIKGHTKTIHVSVGTSGLINHGCTEFILLNEHDACYFDRYCDANGILTGKDIGTWEQTDTGHVALIDSHHNIQLILRNVAQAMMFRGREFIQGRLSWAGIAYVINPSLAHFEYDITIREHT